MLLSDPTLELAYLSVCIDVPASLESGVHVEAMSTPLHRAALACLVAMRHDQSPIDHVTLAHRLESRGVPRESVAGLMSEIRSAPLHSVITLAPILRRLHEARTLSEQALLGASLAADSKTDEARDVLARAAFGVVSPLEVFSIRDAMEAAAEEFQLAATSRSDQLGQARYVKLGLCPTIDQMITVGPGDTVILAAETNVGKSSLSFTCILDLENRGIPAGLVSIEDPKADWGAKAIGHLGRVDTSALWAGTGSQRDWEAAISSVGNVASRNQLARMCVAKSGSLEEVCQAMAILVRVHGARVLFVDYIQAVQVYLRGATRKQEIDHVYRRIQATARLLEVPLVITSQLSRGDDDHKEPTVKRLKESGDLENGAQVIILCWVDRAEGERDWATAPVRAKIAKAKRSPQRARVCLRRGHGGVLHEVPWTDAIGRPRHEWGA